MNYKELLDRIDENTWVSSDHHFGHNNLLKFEPLRAQRAKELGYSHWEDMIVHEHNKIVKENDTVIIMGDFAFKSPQRYLPLLNGNLILVLGNHDRKGLQTYQGIDVVRGCIIESTEYNLHVQQDELFSGIVKDINGVKILFSHYSVHNNDEYDSQNLKIEPRKKILENIYDDFSCDVNIHGHLHSKKSNYKNAISCCLERIDFKPVQIKDLI